MGISEVDLYPMDGLCLVLALGLQDELLKNIVIAGDNAMQGRLAHMQVIMKLSVMEGSAAPDRATGNLGRRHEK